MHTWNAERPGELPPPSLRQKIRGGLRLAALATLTAVCLGLFLIGRALRALFGRWVTFHFAVATAWSRGGLALMGIARKVEGVPLHRGALVANHCSWIDIFALRAVGLMYFVAKAEVADWPGVGYITRVTGTVFIERRRVAAKRQEQVLLERIAANQLLCFFPEGTSTDGLRVLPFKSSLFSAFFHDGHPEPVPIQPVSIRYRAAAGSDLPESFYGWWGSMSFEGHMWEVLCRSTRGTVTVTFHPPVTPDDFPDRKSLADHCGREVAQGHADA